MQLFTLGLNHHTAPLAIRERVAFDAERLRSALSELTAREPVKEAAILSTCNRTELYCALGEPQILGQMKEAARVAESAGTL